MRIEEASKKIVDCILANYPQINEEIQINGLYIPTKGDIGREINRFVIYYQMYGVPKEYNDSIIDWYKAELLPVISRSIMAKEDIKKIGKYFIPFKNYPTELLDEEWIKFYLIYQYANWIKYINSDVLFWLTEECKIIKRERDNADRGSDKSPA